MRRILTYQYLIAELFIDLSMKKVQYVVHKKILQYVARFGWNHYKAWLQQF